MNQDCTALVAALGGWLAERWPHRRNIELTDVRPPIQGFSNETWLLDLHWEEGGARQRIPAVLRLQPGEVALFPSYDLALQYRCMAQLAGTDVPVPRLLAECGVLGAGVRGAGARSAAPGPLGRPFYLMERLPGRAPTENPLYHLDGWVHALPEARRRALWLSGVEMMARVSRLDWRALGFGFLDTPTAGESPLDRQLRGLRDFLGWAEALAEPYPLLRAALAWLEHNRPRGGPVGLCWGDAKLGNCLFDADDDRCIGVLDWESAHLGNPVDDLAWWIMLDRSLCDGYGYPRLAGLPSRAETIAHWERHSGLKADELPYYEVFCAFKFALIMARIGCLFMDRGLVPRTQRMDLNNGGSTILRILAAEQGLPFGAGVTSC